MHFWEPPSLFPAVTRARSKSHTTPNTECVTILYKKVSSVRSNSHSRTFENLRVFPRQLLVRVVNHTLLPIRSVSRFKFSTKYHQFSKAKLSQTHFWEPPSCFRQLLVRVVNQTLLPIRSVSRFSAQYQFSEVKLSQTHFWEPPSLFSAVTFVRRKSHTTPNTECAVILCTISVPSQMHTWEPPSLSWQLLVRVVNHTILLIRSVSRFSTKYQFSEVKPSQTYFWEPPSLSQRLLVRVENCTLLLIWSVLRFSTKCQFIECLTNALLRTTEFFFGSYSCA